MLRLIKLYLQYFLARTLFKKTLLLTTGYNYFIDPEAVRRLDISRRGIRFVGTYYGMEKIYFIPMEEVCYIGGVD